MEGVIELQVSGALDLDSLASADFVGFNLQGSLPPLVMVRTWFSEVPFYQRLARHLGPDQPIYAMGHPTGDEDASYPNDVDEWRDFCLERLAKLDLADPLWIGGWSFGGTVALEMARSLQASGREIAHVVMLDTRIPKRKARTGHGLHDLQQIAVAVQEYTMFPSKKERSDYLRRRIKQRGARVSRKVGAVLERRPGRKPTVLDSGPPRSTDPTMTPLNRAIYVCYLKYSESKLSVPVTQLWTHDSRGHVTGDLTLGWSRVLNGEFQAIGVPGEHLTMFDEGNVEQLADTLRMALERVRCISRKPIVGEVSDLRQFEGPGPATSTQGSSAQPSARSS